MAEPEQFFFTHREVVTALIRKQGLREGFWQLAVQVGIAAANIQHAETNEVVPAAIVPIIKIGLRRVTEQDASGHAAQLIVDAAQVEP